MKKRECTISRSVAFAACLSLLTACGETSGPEIQQSAEEAAPATTVAPAPEPAAQPNVVELKAVGMTFEGPTEIPSGWTTFRFINASNMIHFALIDVPPEGVTVERFSAEAAAPFQIAMDAMNAGDEAAANAAFATFPEWIGELGRNGGPGFLSPGHVAQSTVYLAPGYYVIECYVKSNGVFHTTPPAPGQLGMVLGLTVTDEAANAPEPEANVTLTVRNTGYEITDGALRPGSNTIRVDFAEQQALPSFVSNDVHLMRVDDAESVAQASAWLDWRAPNGLEDPSPVTFLGGLNDLPAGTHGYFSVDLAPGDYAFIAEMPDPAAAGFVLPVTIE